MVAFATGKPPSVHHGDCIEWLRMLPDESVDMIFTDPPYGHNNNDGDLISNIEKALGRGEAGPPRPIANDGEEANDLFREFIREAARVLSSNGACCCCCCCGGGPDPQFARWSLWIDEFLSFKQMVVWDKGPMGLGWHYRRSYEVVLVAHRGSKCRWYDESSKVENVIRPGDRGIRKIIPSAREHPTPKPPELAKLFIELHTEPGDLVIDPFCGGGSTAVACVETGRRFMGCEIDERWCDLARNRISSATPGLFETARRNA